MQPIYHEQGPHNGAAAAGSPGLEPGPNSLHGPQWQHGVKPSRSMSASSPTFQPQATTSTLTADDVSLNTTLRGKQSQPQPQQQQQTHQNRAQARPVSCPTANGHGGGGTRWSGSASSGMGDGIANQSMKDDLEQWIIALGLDPDAPVQVVGYFGQFRDLSMFDRASPADADAALCSEDDLCQPQGHANVAAKAGDERLAVYFEGCRENDESIQVCGGRVSGQESSLGGLLLGFNGKEQPSGDIHVYVDRSKNTIMLQHAYLYDTQEMLEVCLESVEAVKKDRASLMKWVHHQEYESHRALLFLFLVSQVMVHTSPDLNLDPRMISVLLALSALKKQMMQEMDRFMTICWDRIGVPSVADHQRQNTATTTTATDQRNNGGTGRGGGPNSMSNLFTPGKCVPVLIFVVERVVVSAPWHEANASDEQIFEQLKQTLLKKSVDAMQTRLRFVFRACRLIQSIDTPSGVIDARQLFVLPSPSSTPFVHVIPYFISQLHLSGEGGGFGNDSGNRESLDPAGAVLRQKLKSGGPAGKKQGGGGNKGQHPRHRGRDRDREKDRDSTFVAMSNGNGENGRGEGERGAFGVSKLRDLYTAVAQAKDQPLAQMDPWTTSLKQHQQHPSRRQQAQQQPQSTSANAVSLGTLYAEFSGPMLRQFVDGWVTNVTGPGGYGNVLGKRNFGNVMVPSLRQWIAGYLGVSEAMGLTTMAPLPLLMTQGQQGLTEQEESLNGEGGNREISEEEDDDLVERDEGVQGKLAKMSIANGGGSKVERGSSGRRSGGGKRYSTRCANLVQKKIQDFVQTDEVMEELYGVKPDLATTRAHSDRYHQLKADQATKLFQSLAHRR